MPTFTIPGKLYLAGEYAVTSPGYSAVIIAVNRFLSVTIHPATKTTATIQSDNHIPHPVALSWNSGQVTLDIDDPLIQTTLRYTERYITEIGHSIRPYTLYINSQLDLNQTKIGLGSSGAVTIGLIRSVLAHHQLTLSPLYIYKLAMLIHWALGSHGSGGDLAACSFTGCIQYTSPDKTLVNQYSQQSNSLQQTLAYSWPSLIITPLNWPAHIPLLIGWTQRAASTEALVRHSAHTISQTAWASFLDDSQVCVEHLISGVMHHDYSLMHRAITHNRSILQTFAKESHLTLETPALSQLCLIVEDMGGAAKTSGAGGGDCGIAILPTHTITPVIHDKWTTAGITPLPLSIYTERT